MNDFLGSAIIASQCETRDKAQKAINQYAWAAEDAAQAAKNAHDAAAHASSIAATQENTIENQKITIENQKITIENQEKSIKSLENTVQMLQEMLQEKEEEIERTIEIENHFYNKILQLEKIVEEQNTEIDFLKNLLKQHGINTEPSGDMKP